MAGAFVFTTDSCPPATWSCLPIKCSTAKDTVNAGRDRGELWKTLPAGIVPLLNDGMVEQQKFSAKITHLVIAHLPATLSHVDFDAQSIPLIKKGLKPRAVWFGVRHGFSGAQGTHAG
jgi:hypothetical protein